jgi:4-diphosphocytidyl-2-C-methyl-D-erythritol kinase
MLHTPAIPDTVVCRSCAKVNLTLDVLSRRDDGYHELSSVVHTVGLWDELRFKFGAEAPLRCNRPELAGDENLCLKAMRAWLEAASSNGFTLWRGVGITLQKNIPTGAGLGGGSGNAAATLLALNRRYPQYVTEEKLHQIAATLGADVPFFLRGGCALMEGIGDKLTSLPAIDGWLLVVQPAQMLSTPQVYKMWDTLGVTSPRGGRCLEEALEHSRIPTVPVEKLANALHIQVLSNDLGAAAQACGVDVDGISGRLREKGALAASMTGSGSAVFGLFGREAVAKSALQQLRAEPAQCAAGLEWNYAGIVPFCRFGVEFISAVQPS